MSKLGGMIGLALLMSLFSGCSTIYFENGSRVSQNLEYTEWHHDGIFELVEFSDPVNMNERCDGKSWTAIRVEETFIQGLISGVTYSLYNPWDVAYSCQK